MRCVFKGNNSIESRMAADMLELNGIKTETQGESLEMALGEVPLLGIIRVLVHDEDFDKAQQIISDFHKSRSGESNDREE